jgi:hypothetical protein
MPSEQAFDGQGTKGTKELEKNWQPQQGDRVRCVTSALGNRCGQDALVVAAINPDGRIMVRHSGWLPAIASIAVQQSDLALIKEAD